MAEFLKKINKKYFNNKGISLIEALLTIVLAVVLLLSLITLTNFNIRNSTLVTENQDAITSSNLLLENLRSQKDISFSNFINLASSKCTVNFCIVDNDLLVAVSEAEISNLPSPSSYFKVKKITDDEILINIMTRWKVGSSTFSSPISTTFTNWRAK